MTQVKEVVAIDEAELFQLLLFRVALSEPGHESRMRAIRAVRHDVTDNLLQSLFSSLSYKEAGSRKDGPKDDLFLRWVAESGPVRHEAAVHFMEVARRYDEKNERKLNVAEKIGRKIIESMFDGEFRGLHVAGGILEQVRLQGKEERVQGARDKDVLRETWKAYRGVVHFGMAIDCFDQDAGTGWKILSLAEDFRRNLSSCCPRTTKKPYIPASEQIKFIYSSRTKGPRFRDRGLHFFDG